MITHEAAETEYADVGGIKTAYRRLGLSSGVPLVLMMHFRGNMDVWDPAFTNAVARTRPVIIFDNAGIGRTAGEIPTKLVGWATHLVGLLDALGVHTFDLLGFSMGGGAAQLVALEVPHRVRNLIIAGSRTSGNPKTIQGALEIFRPLATSGSEDEFEAAMALSFFPHTPEGQAEAKASWTRTINARKDRCRHLSPELAHRQIEAFKEGFAHPDPSHPYERIEELKMPIFIANGQDDLLIPTKNSYDLAELVPHAHLHIYPDSGHGFLYQHAELFAKHIELFLDGCGSAKL
ncbi:alpha/beta-hydrolase [Pseudohyphozyma bogoriensis]|nr:alpha/beta-hydrolase [Pseudohyphozyma bogoriensis]